MLKFKVTCPFWEFVCHVYFGEPSNHFKIKTGEDFESCAGFVQEGNHTNEFTLWVNEEPTNVKALGILSHEVTHLVNHIYKYHNIKRNEECDEIPAMVHGYIIENILRKYHAKVAKKKNS